MALAKAFLRGNATPPPLSNSMTLRHLDGSDTEQKANCEGSKSVRAVLLNDTRVDRHHGCTTVVETIDRLAIAHGICITARAPAHVDWRQDLSVTKAIESADLLIVNGEGTIHHDRPAGFFLMAAGEYARQRGKRAVLINATWQANSPALSEKLGCFDLIAVRENKSAAQIRSTGFDCRVVPDLALYCQPPISPRREGIGYTDSVLGPTALELYDRMSTLEGVGLSLLYGRKSATDLARSFKRFAPAGSAWTPSKVLRAMRGARIDWQTQQADRRALLQTIGTMRLIVTGRFHMMILALAARTPVLVAASNTHKNIATLQDAGLESWRHVSVESLDRKLIERAMEWTADEHDALETFVSNGRAAMRALFTDIRALV